MDESTGKIEAALHSADPIPRETVRAWVRDCQDVETLGALYELTNKAWNRIDPTLEKKETCQLICRYFITCIRENPQSEKAMSAYVAAGNLEAWVDYMADQGDMEKVLQDIAKTVTNLYLASNTEVQNVIETGFLEHVLEQQRLVHLFAYWADDERLKESWECALAWGLAHPDYMRGIRAKLRDFQSPKG